MSFKAELKYATVDGFKAIFASRKMLVMFLLGFSSGLPLMLTASTLMLWFGHYDVNVQNIGLLSLIQMPYTLKFLWSPVLDRFQLPFMSKRKDWILTAQIGLLAAIVLITFYTPEHHPFIIALIGLIICFLSATQDIAINAYQVDILEEKERALGSAVSVLGYRIAMFVSGTGIILMASFADWQIAYLSAGFCLFIGIFGVFIAPKIPPQSYQTPQTMIAAVFHPIKEFWTRINWRIALLMLAIIIVYKLGDALAFSLNSVFFLNGLNFNLVEIGIAFKTNALVFTMLGAILGGLLIKKIGIYRGFLYFSIVMACANLVYLLLALVGKSYFLMAASVAVEYFAGGLGTSAFLAMLLSLCHHSFSATQFAIFSSLDSVGRVFVGPLAGWIANDYSWALLFFISFLIGMGTTGVIWLAKNPIYRLTSLTS